MLPPTMSSENSQVYPSKVQIKKAKAIQLFRHFQSLKKKISWEFAIMIIWTLRKSRSSFPGERKFVYVIKFRQKCRSSTFIFIFKVANNTRIKRKHKCSDVSFKDTFRMALGEIINYKCLCNYCVEGVQTLVTGGIKALEDDNITVIGTYVCRRFLQYPCAWDLCSSYRKNRGKYLWQLIGWNRKEPLMFVSIFTCNSLAVRD